MPNRRWKSATVKCKMHVYAESVCYRRVERRESNNKTENTHLVEKCERFHDSMCNIMFEMAKNILFMNRFFSVFIHHLKEEKPGKFPPTLWKMNSYILSVFFDRCICFRLNRNQSAENLSFFLHSKPNYKDFLSQKLHTCLQHVWFSRRKNQILPKKCAAVENYPDFDILSETFTTDCSEKKFEIATNLLW